MSVRKTAQVPFFQELTTEDLEYLQQACTEYGFSSDETIKDFDQTLDGYWVLLDGAWRWETQSGIVREMAPAPGSWLGPPNDLSIIEAWRVNATATSYVLNVPEVVMRELVEKHPTIRQHLLAGIHDTLEVYRTTIQYRYADSGRTT